MNIHVLRTFLAVAEHEGLRRAADFLHLTPSAVSSRIRQLERSLNTRLFERSKAGVRLTPAGQKLAARSRKLIREWQDIRQDISQGSGDAVFLRLGASDALWQAWLLAATVDYCHIHPRTRYVLKTAGRRDLAAMLIADSLDCVFIPEALANPGFESRKLTGLRLIPVCTQEMKAQEANRFDGLVEVDWGDVFADRLEVSGVVLPEPTLQVNVAWLAIDWLLRSGGSAWLPEHLVSDHIQAGRLRRISEWDAVDLDVYAAFGKENIEAEAMVRVLHDSLAGAGS